MYRASSSVRLLYESDTYTCGTHLVSSALVFMRGKRRLGKAARKIEQTLVD
jgi:hypothetical protein